MVMLVKMILAQKGKNPRFVIVTDKLILINKLEITQLRYGAYLRAGTGKGLKTILKDKGNIVITTLINKFETVFKNRYLETDSDKFYVLIDEAHRSQYSSMYNYMREVLPNTTLIAFGHPSYCKQKKNTYKKFGALFTTIQ